MNGKVLFQYMQGSSIAAMKTTSLVVIAALALSASLLPAQDNSGTQTGGAVVVVGGQPAGAVVGSGQLSPPIVINGGGAGGPQSFTFGASGTNGFDGKAFSKAMQDGMKQAFGDGSSNLFGGGGGGAWNPAKLMQQLNERALENVRDGLGLADDAEWSAVRPLVEKVIEIQQQNDTAAQQLRSRRFFGGNNPMMKNFAGAFKSQESPEQSALQQAVDDNASAGQVRDAIVKFRAAQKEQQAKLEEAQAGLRKVLTAKQEAKAILLGLLN